MYLLDTDILIWAIRGRQDIVNYISFLKQKSPTGISVLSVAEIYKNIFTIELSKVEDYISQHIMFDVDVNIAKLGGRYWQTYHKKFTKLGIIDCMIAATAKENELGLLTLNTRHFPMKDIRVMDPLRS